MSSQSGCRIVPPSDGDYPVLAANAFGQWWNAFSTSAQPPASGGPSYATINGSNICFSNYNWAPVSPNTPPNPPAIPICFNLNDFINNPDPGGGPFGPLACNRITVTAGSKNISAQVCAYDLSLAQNRNAAPTQQGAINQCQANVAQLGL